MNRQELHEAIDHLSEDQILRVIQIVELIQADASSKPGRDLTRFAGILKLTEDPLTYQERMRNEWL